MAALMPIALVPDVMMLPLERIVMAPSLVPNWPIVPTLMPAENVPDVAMLPDEITVAGP